MNKFICAEGSNAGSIVVYVILIVALLAMLIMPYFTQKKKNQEFMKMLDDMKVGDLVKTAGGIIGRITKISDKGDIKTVILETGSKSEKSYMEFDMSMIYCVLKSTKVENKSEDSDKDAEVETKPEIKDEIEEKEATDVISDVVKAEVNPIEEKKIKSAKKTTKTKTTSKKETK